MERLTITRIVHASVLLQFGGSSVLTDPWFAERPGHCHGEPLGLRLEDLPQLSAVICSHNHFHHFDMRSFQSYPDHGVPMIVNPGMEKLARTAGFTNIFPLEPWRSVTIGPLRVSATPSRHGTPDNTYVVRCGGRMVFIAADSLRVPEARSLVERYAHADVALLPIQGLRLRVWFHHQLVMDPEQAAVIAGLLQPHYAVPTHYRASWGRFRDRFLLQATGTVEGFAAAMAREAPQTLVRVLPPGEPLEVD